MSKISSTDAPLVKLMRWVARFLSIPWAFWALFITFFVVGSAASEEEISSAFFMIIMIIASLLFMGAAIIASVWAKEALGGGVLLVDGVLLFVGLLALHVRNHELVFTIFTLVLPPLVAGSLFLACHRISKTSGEQHVKLGPSNTGSKIVEN